MIGFFKRYEETQEEIRYVCDVDEDGLPVRKEPGGHIIGEILKPGDIVVVLENQGYWTKIGNKKWVWSFSLSKRKPKTKKVFNAKKPVIIYDEQERKIGELHNGDTIQVFDKTRTKYKISKNDNKWIYRTNLK